ncbi:peptide ABC transporter permease [Pseudomonas fluorescens]|uniref:Peptide ABC transporter permease n=1 Tax=Pseudomonas fluorescens TaxID=294 RepID=A0A1T2Z8I0_PSEFL|nr:ABC transporter permease [Pseudomonas fluorescens]OPB00952.1 peptide ABC transporter permease [Pseudomonas fluorescens]
MKAVNETLSAPQHKSFFTELRKLRTNSKIMISGILLILFCVVAIFAPWIAPHDPNVQDLAHRLYEPWGYAKHDGAHFLGTDGFGRDYLSRMIYGARIALLIGLLVMVIAGLIGVTIGMTAGYFGGAVDHVLMFVINSRLCLPVFLVVMAVVVVFGPSLSGTVLILGLLQWERFAIVSRSATQQIAGSDYILAAKMLGFSHWRIIFSEMLPNIASSLIVVATLEMSWAIILESSLSFIGFGVQEPTPSWGLMLAQAKQYIFFEPWLLYLPGVALVVLVLTINTFGDGFSQVTEGGLVK